MKVVKLFEEFLEDGVARKISPDIQRAKHLRQESERKQVSLEKSISKIGIDDDNANDYVEYCYNILMFLIRSKMFEEGCTTSGQGAHEAEVAYARNLKFTDQELELLDQLRYFRNGILYYGKQFDKEYAEKVIEFTKKICERL